ncbi:MAG: GEVED domain-containing protein [Ferruginibacter sp.]
MKKRFLFFAFALLSALASMAQFPAPYCAEAYGSGVEPITSVTFSNINNTSAAAIGGAAHENFLSVIGNVQSGASYLMTVKGNTDGDFSDYIRVFIDWNNNNLFTDAGEGYDIGIITNSTGTDAITASASILVPSAQAAGNVRMRVTKKFLSYQFSCNISGYGQSEDYTLAVTVPSCLPPGTPSVSAITASSATFSWTAVAGASGYQYQVSTSATPPASGTATAGTSVNATGLGASTQYYAHVRTDCGAGGFSTWLTVPFITSCNSTNIPYSENFNSVTAPAAPPCIVIQDLNGASAWENMASPVAVVIGAPNSMVYAYDAATGADDWFFLQGLNLTAGTSYRLTFSWKSNPSFPESFEVKYGSSPNAAAMTIGTLYTNTNAASSSVVIQSADFTPSSTGVFYIGFHCNSAADQDFLAIDDITVNLTPSCINPSGLAINAVSTSSANFSWNTVAGSAGYEWHLSTSATPPASGTATASTTTLLSGLISGTQYYAHVRNVCTGPSYSSWSTLSFGWIPNDSACGAKPLLLNGAADCINTTAATSLSDPSLPGGCSSPNNTVWYSYTPAASGQVIVRTEIPAASSNGLNGWIAWYTGTSCPGTTLTAVAGSVCQAFGPTAGQVDSLLSPVLTGGVTYYIMIDGFSGDVGDVCIGIVTPPPPPACVTNINPANAATGISITPTISWNAAATATSYDVFFGTVNPPTTNIGTIAAPATSADITGLDYGTTYYWYIVPSNVGGAAAGCNTNVTSFTTLNTPANCVPLYGAEAGENCSGGDYISLFRLKGETTQLNINTGSGCNSPTAYVDSTDHPVIIDLARGKSYWGQALCGFADDAITIWIDFDDDGLFEDAEKLMNNLEIGSTLTNFNLFIPLTANTGNHRMRVRCVYGPNGMPTDPCTFYTYGETEDYTVNITSSGTSYTVSTYTSAGACNPVSGSIIIDDLSNNNSGYVPIVDSVNAIVAQLYPQGNILGRVTTSYYKHNGAVRQTTDGRYYLDRNITITPEFAPTTPYNLRFYYLNSELNALIAQSGSGVTSQFDLVCTKNDNACLAAINALASAGGVLLSPTGFGTLGGDRLLDFTNITGLSSFYLHGGTTALPVTLVSFNASRSGKQNNITWSTSQEINTSHFILERSSNGSDFVALTRIAAAGNSSVTRNYQYTDAAPLTGMNYYRLRIVDLDNRESRSAIKQVRNDAAYDLQVYPNPARDIVQLELYSEKASQANLIITDIAGKVMHTQTIRLSSGNNKLPVNISRFASGGYLFKVSLEEGTVIRKINKQ